ncbi:MAG TPA: glycosyl transferase family 2 [Thermosipho africanus]|uniref:Glycosyl transferase family 2 n=1 Tax=Thermococcus sibiricus TaxID=172049 RepID=A0A101EK61_9EURY|nr:glycosyltransferase [Thermococcus sibiricus]KUK16863.1 MAG: Glycosyl transferase family 2 [Thermococcus sibiricus]HCF38329.1 glycosyl transferase family 2 [Thermosipho africanus]
MSNSKIIKVHEEHRAEANVCALIVTYGNRHHLLSRVINACLRNGVKKIIVVDNASEKESKERLKELSSELKNKLKVIELKENLGSAGGYKKGLEYIYNCPECEFVWLLDDDNLPREGALEALIQFYRNLNVPHKEYRVALLSFRVDRDYYKEAVIKNNSDPIIGRKNSFLRFHILEIHKILLKLLKKIIDPKASNNNVLKKKYKSIILAASCYGGLFFNKKLINEIGYPNEEFFAYFDDHEWTYRLTRKGGCIFLVVDSIIEDLEKSWALKHSFPLKALSLAPDFRIYYGVRNRVYFEKMYLVNNPFLYRLNTVIFLIIARLFLSKHKYMLLRRAINDGLSGKLGMIKDSEF